MAIYFSETYPEHSISKTDVYKLMKNTLIILFWGNIFIFNQLI